MKVFQCISTSPELHLTAKSKLCGAQEEGLQENTHHQKSAEDSACRGGDFNSAAWGQGRPAGSEEMTALPAQRK